MHFTTHLQKNCNREVNEIGNLEDLKLLDVSQNKGVYIFCSNSIKFIYPKDTSNVIYIGKADNLRIRLKKHKYHLNNIQAYAEKDKHTYWTKSLYNYLEKYGNRVFFIPAKTSQNAHDLEGIIFSEFFKKYLSIPVGNGAYSSGRKK